MRSASMRMETTGRKIARSLVAHGVDTVFGIPGAHTYDLADAFHAERNRLRFIHTRHEQGAGYMAYGYAKSSGRPGVFSVVPGPGVLNAGAAMCTAWGADTPVMCVTGNIMSHLIGLRRGQLHELPDQLATLRGLTKAAERIEHPSSAYSTMAELFTKMTSGRQGPVAVEAPWDVFGQEGPAGEPVIGAPLSPPEVDADRLEAAARLLKGARNPLIVVGAGALGASAEIRALAERLQAPVTSYRSGKGVIPGDDPLWLDSASAFEYWKTADLLIGVGSALRLPYMLWQWLPEGMKTIRIDIDPTEFVRLKPDIGIVADAADGARALIAALETGHGVGSRAEELRGIRGRMAERINGIQPQMDYLRAIREVLPRDGFFVEEVSQMGFAARFGLPVYAPRQYVTCGFQENLGFGYGAALGVKVANPDRPVVSISGDGGFMFGAQELATAAQHGIAVVAIVFDNGAYGNVRRDQMTHYDGRLIGSDLVNPDFLRLAESFGVAAFRAKNPGALRKALEQALSLESPSLIHVPVERGSEGDPWPVIKPTPPGAKAGKTPYGAPES
ncbi:MAG: thiamine pyrophosphate-dependent enzyme [Pikeienuella sp.]